jgi:hypothetical protein
MGRPVFIRVVAFVAILLAGCGSEQTAEQQLLGPGAMPDESSLREPSQGDPYDLTGGVFILHAPPGLAYSVDPPAGGWCAGSVWGTTCGTQVNTMPCSDDYEWVWYIVSNFYESKTFKAVEYGIIYDPDLYLYAAGTLCTPSAALTIEYPATGDWPDAGSGISIALTGTPYWTGTMVTSGMVYGWHYCNMVPTSITLGPMPLSGGIGWLAPDARTFAAACIGVLGIDMAGQSCCSVAPQACCFADGHCEVRVTADCSAAGGVVYPDPDCDPNPCPVPTQACCIGADCQELTPAACVAQGGVVYPDPDCDPNPCPVPTQACCIGADCQELTPAACVAQGGVVYPDPDCDPNPCPVPTQACCIGADCQELTPAACVAQGGVVYPDPDCDPNPCPVPTQACCIGADCQELTPAACVAQGGVVYPDPDCDPNPCPVAPQACCFEAICQALTPADCVAQGGVVYADLTCTPNPCPVEGCGRPFWKDNAHLGDWGPTGYAPGDLVDEFFDVPPELDLDTFMYDLRYRAGSYPKLDTRDDQERAKFVDAARVLMGQAVAALLNAAHPNVSYSLTEAQVIEGVNAALATEDINTVLQYKEVLEDYNQASCPLD